MVKHLGNRDTEISSKQRHVTISHYIHIKYDILFMSLLSFFLWHIKHLKCLTCCGGGRRSHTHAPPLCSGCGVPNSPCGGGHVSLRVTGAAGSCVLQSYTGHLSPDPRDHSLLLLLSVCCMTDCAAPPQTSLPATANTNLPPPAHFT